MMIQITLFLLALGFLAYFQLRSILTHQKRKDAILYALLMGTAGVIGSLLIAGVKIPSPAVPIRHLFEPIANMILQKQ